jgi:hypothetical protein
VTPALWVVVALCALAAAVLVACALRRRADVRRLFDEPPFRTADGILIDRQTRALRAQVPDAKP